MPDLKSQYQSAKRSCPNGVCLFRTGDFYEAFFEDAAVLASTLGLTITSRSKNSTDEPMAGFPYHQLESYLQKLVASGLRVAVCELVNDRPHSPPLVKVKEKREPEVRLHRENADISKAQCRECGAFLMVVDSEGVGASVCPNGHGKMQLVIQNCDVRRAESLVADAAFVSTLPEFGWHLDKGKERYTDKDGLVYRSSHKKSLSARSAKRRILKGQVIGRCEKDVRRFVLMKKQPKVKS